MYIGRNTKSTYLFSCQHLDIISDFLFSRVFFDSVVLFIYK